MAGVAKVTLNGETLIDVTDDTVEAGSMLSGVTALKKNGDRAVGTISGTNSAVTGISIADHSTSTVFGVQSTTTTASSVTMGTAFTVPNVTSAGTAANWVFESVDVPIANDAPTHVPIKNATATTIPNVTAVGSGSFTQGAFDGGSGSFAATVTNHILSFSHTHTAATHENDTHVHTAPTLGTAFTIYGVSSTTTDVYGVGSSTTTASRVVSGGNGTAPTLGTAFTIPNVSSVTSVTVPIKNTASTTVVTGSTHTITDNGHTHTIGS